MSKLYDKPFQSLLLNTSFDWSISDFLRMFSNNILKPHTFLNNVVCTFDKYKLLGIGLDNGNFSCE